MTDITEVPEKVQFWLEDNTKLSKEVATLIGLSILLPMWPFLWLYAKYLGWKYYGRKKD